MTAKQKKKVEPPVDEETVEEMGDEISPQEEEQDMACALEEARAKLQESEDKVLRLAADFDNSKKDSLEQVFLLVKDTGFFSFDIG